MTNAAEQTDRLLSLEQAAADLLDELERLRNETVGVADAHGALNQLAENLSVLLGSAAASTSRIGEAAVTLRELGTPQLLEAIRESTDRMEDRAGRAVSKLDEVNGHFLAAIEQWGTALAQRLDGQSERQARAERQLRNVSLAGVAAVLLLAGLQVAAILA